MLQMWSLIYLYTMFQSFDLNTMSSEKSSFWNQDEGLSSTLMQTTLKQNLAHNLEIQIMLAIWSSNQCCQFF
jgi:hypothetical protein